jgi:CRISPR-associated protein Cmr6
MKIKGKVTKYFKDKGFGFITYDNGDIFFHITAVKQKDEITEGIEVEFEIGKNKEGKICAKNVLLLKAKTNQVESYEETNYLLPIDTLSCLDVDHIDNFNLLLNKTAYFDGEKFLLYKRDRNEEKINLAKKYSSFNQKYKNLIKAVSESYEKAVTQLVGKNNLFSDIFSPNWRLIIGLGGESVYETSITLHHIYGIPYIPGQAIKGVTRSYIINECFNQKEEEALRDELFCYIFGSPKKGILKEHQGSVIFFDAYPIDFPKLEIDIMNPHYGDYYQGNAPPADYLNPNPIFFLTVGKDSKFKFFVGIKNIKIAKEILKGKKSPILDRLNLDENLKLIGIAFELMKKALAEQGIGAKSSLGYGIFK